MVLGLGDHTTHSLEQPQRFLDLFFTPSLFRANNLKRFKDFYWTPRPESCLDCLMCAMFARQRFVRGLDDHAPHSLEQPQCFEFSHHSSYRVPVKVLLKLSLSFSPRIPVRFPMGIDVSTEGVT